MIRKHGVSVVLGTLVVLICAGVTPGTVLADGSETLGPPSIPIGSGTGIVIAGVGLTQGQPGTILIDIPAEASISQVLLYWEGQMVGNVAGDDTIEVTGFGEISGALIGGQTYFGTAKGVGDIYCSAFRADVTELGLVGPGPNSVEVGGLTYSYANNGAGILVILDEGSGEADIQVLDGLDLAFYLSPPPINTTVAQIFTFAAASHDRTATLSLFFSSVAGSVSTGGFRPTAIEVTVAGSTEVLNNLLNSADGEEWDSLAVGVLIPAEATSLTVQALSADNLGTGDKPASLGWVAAGLSVPPEVVGCQDAGECDDGVACTVDDCVSGNCVNTPDNGNCDDGLYCNGAEVCDPALDCLPGTDPCLDGNDCTDDVCDEEADTCENSCNASGPEDPCCNDPACSEDPVCEHTPECGDGIIDPGEICGEPGLDPCPDYAPICLNCGDCGIPVELLYFRADGSGSIVTLTWATASEIDTAGFNLLRSSTPDGPFVMVNGALISAKGGPAQGASYSYIDNSVRNGFTYWYKLEDVSALGESYFYDTMVSVVPSANGWTAASGAEASAIGSATTTDSRLANAIAVLLVPIGAVWILRRIRRR